MDLRTNAHVSPLRVGRQSEAKMGICSENRIYDEHDLIPRHVPG